MAYLVRLDEIIPRSPPPFNHGRPSQRRRQARCAPRHAREGAVGRGPAPHRRAAREGEADGEGAHRLLPRRRELQRDRLVRAAPLQRVRAGQATVPRRRGRNRLRQGGRTPHLRLRTGLHRDRRHAFQRGRSEGVQGHGPGDGDGSADGGAHRFGRRQDPGGNRQPHRVRLHLLPQRTLLRDNPPDIGDHGPRRRRRHLLARPDGLRVHG